LVVSERAQADLREIWRYSFKSWGEAQADRYLDDLDAGLSRMTRSWSNACCTAAWTRTAICLRKKSEHLTRSSARTANGENARPQ
jgi:hypothetical protein